MKINELEKRIQGFDRSIKRYTKLKENSKELRSKTESEFNKYTYGLELKSIENFLAESKKEIDRLNYIDKQINKDSKEVFEKRDGGTYLKASVKTEKEKLNETLLDNLSKASDDEKIAFGEYLYDKSLIGNGCGGFGGYKNPTTCGGCINGERIVNKLGLEKYVVFEGDRCYGIPEKKKEQAKKNLFEKSLNEKDKAELKARQKKKEETLRPYEGNQKKISSKLADLETKKGKFEIKKKAYSVLDKAKVDYEQIEKKMPDFFKEIIRERDQSGVTYATAKPEKGIGVIITDDWYSSGSGGCEYGVTVIVSRGDKSEEKYFKYRDPYEASADNWDLFFGKAEITKVDDKGIEVKLISNKDYETVERFSIEKQKKNLEKRLTEEEQGKFTEKCEEIEKELIKRHFRENATMPGYMDYWGFKGTIPSGIDTGKSVPYNKPQIIDKYLDAKRGKGAIVIKAQIDYRAGSGKQYEWVGYTISKKGEPKAVTRDCAYQMDIKEGKRISMKARDLLKEKEK